MTETPARPMHYWTGRGTLCSLENNVWQQPNHTSDRASVTCVYCNYQMALNAKASKC